jgi:hypothetical protein
MLEAIAQVCDVVAMGTGGIDLTRSLVVVLRGRGRSVPFGQRRSGVRPPGAAHLSGERGAPRSVRVGVVPRTAAARTCRSFSWLVMPSISVS